MIFISKQPDTWPSVSYGGYYPVILSIQNRGPDATIQLKVTIRSMYGSTSQSPTVEKTLTLAQNATVKITLPVPVVARDSSFQLQGAQEWPVAQKTLALL